MKTRARATALAIACSAALPAAHATNGYMSHAYSPASKGMAGAGEAALPQDSLAIVGNPAGVTRVGRRGDAGATWFSPQREYDGLTPDPATGAFAPIGGGRDGTGTVESRNEDFLIPHLGYSHPIDERSAFGIAVFANGGMNTDFRSKDTLFQLGTFGSNNPLANPPSFQAPDPRAGTQVPGTRRVGSGNAGVNLEQLGLSLAYGRDVTDTLSLGASFLVGYQTIEVDGVGAFQGFTQTFTQTMIASGGRGAVSPGNLTNNGRDSSSSGRCGMRIRC
jgi:long-chain fatty acid transport protein